MEGKELHAWTATCLICLNELNRNETIFSQTKKKKRQLLAFSAYLEDPSVQQRISFVTSLFLRKILTFIDVWFQKISIPLPGFFFFLNPSHYQEFPVLLHTFPWKFWLFRHPAPLIRVANEDTCCRYGYFWNHTVYF